MFLFCQLLNVHHFRQVIIECRSGLAPSDVWCMEWWHYQEDQCWWSVQVMLWIFHYLPVYTNPIKIRYSLLCQAVWMVEWVSLVWLAGSQGRVIASALESLESLRHQQFEWSNNQNKRDSDTTVIREEGRDQWRLVEYPQHGCD